MQTMAVIDRYGYGYIPVIAESVHGHNYLMLLGINEVFDPSYVDRVMDDDLVAEGYGKLNHLHQLNFDDETEAFLKTISEYPPAFHSTQKQSNSIKKQLKAYNKPSENTEAWVKKLLDHLSGDTDLEGIHYAEWIERGREPVLYKVSEGVECIHKTLISVS